MKGEKHQGRNINYNTSQAKIIKKKRKLFLKLSCTFFMQHEYPSPRRKSLSRKIYS